MTFTVSDFQDLLRLLDEHPEWRAEMRRQLLTEELLGLPALVQRVDDRLTEFQGWTESALERLTAAQARTEEQVQQLAAAQVRTEARLDELADSVNKLVIAQTSIVTRLENVETRLGNVESRLGHVEGMSLELKYARQAGSYFGPLARRIRVVDNTHLADLLDDAVDDGRLEPDELQAVLRADLVLTGRSREHQGDMYLLVEVSVGIRPDDVIRAAERAAILEKLGQPVLPVVAGGEINGEAATLASERGVWRVLNGYGVL